MDSSEIWDQILDPSHITKCFWCHEQDLVFLTSLGCSFHICSAGKSYESSLSSIQWRDLFVIPILYFFNCTMYTCHGRDSGFILTMSQILSSFFLEIRSSWTPWWILSFLIIELNWISSIFLRHLTFKTLRHLAIPEWLHYLLILLISSCILWQIYIGLCNIWHKSWKMLYMLTVPMSWVSELDRTKTRQKGKEQGRI